MNYEPLSMLSVHDPLYRFLAEEVLDKRLGFRDYRPEFQVCQLDDSSTVYLYIEPQASTDLVCKFYGNKWLHGSQKGDSEKRVEMMRREFDNLNYVRSLSLDHSRHNVVRPFVVSEELNCVLVEEFASGRNLDSFVSNAIDSGDTNKLHERIKDVAWFLADLHNHSTVSSGGANEESALLNLQDIISNLAYWNIISFETRNLLDRLCEKWAKSRLLGNVREVFIHGDANPTNFLWGPDNYLTVIDLERLYKGDRAADLGCMAAELKHLFWTYGQGPWGSEPYIQQLYAGYADHLPEGVRDFEYLTTRGRFYMGCTELQISRNSWLDLAYRQRLIEDAIECLRI